MPKLTPESKSWRMGPPSERGAGDRGKAKPGVYICLGKNGDLVVIRIRYQQYIDRPGSYLCVKTAEGSCELKDVEQVEIDLGIGPIVAHYGPIQIPKKYDNG